MAQAIKKLSAPAMSLLSSSQVIVSVSSAVKELVENSLDAGATNIITKLRNGGFDGLEVHDNGCGIAMADAPYIALPHFTSKIIELEDLNSVLSYGFRGVALSSLCAISDLVVTTKTATDDVGYSYSVDHLGRMVSSKPISHSQGTTVTCNNLFKNLPVRKKYLDSAKHRQAELKKVEDLVMVFAAIQPGVRFALHHDGSLIWQKASVSEHRAALLQIWGCTVMNAMQHVQMEDLATQVAIEAYLPKPTSLPQQMTRSNIECCMVAINCRPVRMKDVDKIIQQHCSLCHGKKYRYPMCFVSIVLPPRHIDVNLEPDKTKVLLENSNAVLELLKSVLGKVYASEPSEDLVTDEKQSRNECVSKLLAHNVVEDKTLNPVVCESNEGIDKEISPDLMGEQHASHAVPRAKMPVPLTDKSPPSIAQTSSKLGHQTSQAMGVSSEKSTLSCYPSPKTAVAASTRTILDSLPQISQEEEGAKGILQQAAFPDNVFELSMPTGVDFDSSFSDIESEDSGVRNASKSKIGEADANRVANHLLVEDMAVDDEDGIEMLPSKSKGVNPPRSLWSCGRMENGTGSILEPVQVLQPTGTLKRASLSQRLNSAAKLVSKKQKRVTGANQTKILGLIGGQVVRKPSTALEFFYREMGEKVASENFSGSRQTTAIMLQNSWEALDPETKAKFQQMADKDKARFEKTLSQLEQKPMKRHLIGKTKTTAHPGTKNRKTTTVEFGLNILKDHFKNSQICSQSQTLVDEWQLIGQIKPSGMWIVFQNGIIYGANHFCMQEAILYQCLMATHSLQAEPLTSPMALPPNMVGGVSAWSLLMKMTSEARNNGYCHITDKKVVANGFDIRTWTEPSSKPAAEIAGMATCLPGYGIPDLCELLATVSMHGLDIPVEKSRPSKVLHYLQAEAVRMSRNLAPRPLEADMREVLSKCNCLGIDACLHGRPFFHQVFSLDSLPPTQG